ncbi:transposase [Streptomyces sp. NPDC051658]|uniref:transposase n=1 Tax=Streptomyces sp. NPDC051658 TaxID=3365667 RepID=UPI0037A694CA
MTAAGHELSALVLDIDATLITCHSEKEAAVPTYKNGFGYHPLLCFLANTGEGMSGLLRPGSAGANTAADHITSSTRPSHRSLTLTGTAPRSLSVPTAPDPRKPSWPTSTPCGRTVWTCASPSDTRSPNRSAERSGPSPTNFGTPPWTRTGPCATVPRSPS